VGRAAKAKNARLAVSGCGKPSLTPRVMATACVAGSFCSAEGLRARSPGVEGRLRPFLCGPQGDKVCIVRSSCGPCPAVLRWPVHVPALFLSPVVLLDGMTGQRLREHIHTTPLICACLVSGGRLSVTSGQGELTAAIMRPPSPSDQEIRCITCSVGIRVEAGLGPPSTMWRKSWSRSRTAISPLSCWARADQPLSLPPHRAEIYFCYTGGARCARRKETHRRGARRFRRVILREKCTNMPMCPHANFAVSGALRHRHDGAPPTGAARPFQSETDDSRVFPTNPRIDNMAGR